MKRGPRAERDTGHLADTNALLARLNADNYVLTGGTLAHIQEAVADARADGAGINAGVVTLGPGDYVLSDTADLFRGALGLQIRGCGQATRFICDFNDATKTMVKIANAQRCTLEDVQFVVPSGKAAKAAVQIVYDHGAGINTRWNHLRNAVIDGRGGVLTNGILIGDDDGALYRDNTNDFHKLEDVEIHGVTEAGCAIGGGNAYQNVFSDCHFHDGKYGVLAGRGSYSWYGGGMYGQSVACFTKGHWYGSVEIHSVVCEGTECLIRTSGGDFVVVNARWADNGSEGMKAVYVDTPGAEVQMTFTQCMFGDGGNENSDGEVIIDRPIMFDCTNAGANSAIAFKACVMYSTADPMFLGVNEVWRNVRVLDEQRNIRQLLPDIG